LPRSSIETRLTNKYKKSRQESSHPEFSNRFSAQRCQQKKAVIRRELTTALEAPNGKDKQQINKL